MAFYTETEQRFKQSTLSYHTCKDIYRNSVMGKRVVEALVNFSMSAERDISVQKAPPEAVDQFKIISKQLKQEEAIKRTIYNARIYGTGALYVALHNISENKDDFTTKPNFHNAKRFDIRFNVLDPQNIAGSTFDLNPLSFHFLELINIKVDNQLVPRKRIAISHALEPLYLDNRTSLIPYSPPSVFYNMIDLLKDYDEAIEALDNLLYKAGAIVYKYKAGGKFSGIQIDAIKRSAEILEQKKNGAVISIDSQCDIEDFPINNVNGLIESVNKLEDAITKALNDTPASLLFDKSLSNGFSEGDKDKETEISIIEAFRENKLIPLYTLTDYYIMLKAWDDNFINEIKDKYSDLQDKSNTQLFYEWCNSFKYEFGNLFPEPESITIENNSKKLDNLLKLQQLGANAADIEAELNEDEIFKNEVDLDGQQPAFDMNDDDIDDASAGMLSNTQVDTNMLRIDDADNIPAGTEWKTLENGEHVLINSESGEILSGAGIENWKNTGKATNPNTNKKTEDTNAKKRSVSQIQKEIKEQQDLERQYSRDAYGAGTPEDYEKYNKLRNEAQSKRMKLESELTEAKKEAKASKPKVNAEAEKNKETKKKITKNYSISYDAETIEKLNKLGKNWKDKRIYFKDLNNSYYDLENEKWVCDKPETTERALMIAGENEAERGARLEAEKQEREAKERAEYEAKEKAKEERKEYLREYNKKTMNRIYNEDDDYISNKFSKEVGKAMYEAGIFEEGYIPTGSINKIKSKLFTDEEIRNWDELYKQSINDIVYDAVKTELNHVQNMYRPLKWGDWLWREKDLNNGSQSVNDIEDMTDEDPDMIREELNFKYINNKTAWEKFGEEFNQYKANYKKEAKEKIKEYIKKNYADAKIDNKIKIDSSDIDIKSESEIDNDIEYYIDNLIEYIDAKAKDDEEWKTLKNGEHVLVNGDGEIVSGIGGANNNSQVSKSVSNLPEHLQSTGYKVYSDAIKAGEFIETNGKTDIDKINSLTKIEKAIYDYTVSGEELDEEIKEEITTLIKNSPITDRPLYRGVNGRFNYKEGEVIPLNISSFSEVESVAHDFIYEAEGYIYVIKGKHRGINISGLSEFAEDEMEYLTMGEYKVEKINKKDNILIVEISEVL